MKRQLIMKNFLPRTAVDLDPGYFSFVMATGIVSIAAFQQQMAKTANVLFFINKIAYVILIIHMTTRCVLFPKQVFIDMTSPSRAPSLFTITAGTCILGSQYIVLAGGFHAGFALWSIGLFFWIVLIYTFFTAVIITNNKSSREEELNGGWLIYVVGTQAVAIVSMLLTSSVTRQQDVFLFLAVSMHAAGSALYFIIMVLIARRMMFLDLPPGKLSPRYWINMGAAAISTFAGAELILHLGDGSSLREALPALKWITLMFWAVTTWWIPLICLLNIWRYGYKRFPLTYDVQYWSMVFPLGMYTACSFQLGKAMELTALIHISHYFIYLALSAWIVTFTGMVRGLFRKLT